MVHLMLMWFTTRKKTFFGNSTVKENEDSRKTVIEASSLQTMFNLPINRGLIV